MQPVIIFEGHDRSGKTTIANALANYYDTEVFMTNSKECFTSKGDYNNLAKFNLKISEFVKEVSFHSPIDKPIIIYRSFMSEMVYSKLFNRKTNAIANALTDDNFYKVNATIVLCENVRERYNDVDISDELINKSIELYRQVKLNVRTDILSIKTKEHDVDRYVREIVDFVNKKYS